MRIVFCGTPDFGVPALRLLLSDPSFDVVAVVSQPDRPRGRGGAVATPPTKETALAAGVRVYQPEKIKAEAAYDFFKEIAPDAVVIIAYGQIIPARLIALPRLGWINLHASLLPQYRGAAPIAWAVANGETMTGLTTMRIDPGMDTGPTLLKKEMAIGADETAPELTLRMCEAGAPLVVDSLKKLDRGEIAPQPQDNSQATYAPILKKEHGRIDWSRSAQEIYNRIRGLSPWPGAFTEFRGQLCHIWGRPSDSAAAAATQAPGTLFAGGGTVYVVCGEASCLTLEAVQIEGRKRISGREFSNGARLLPGERFSNNQSGKVPARVKPPPQLRLWQRPSLPAYTSLMPVSAANPISVARKIAFDVLRQVAAEGAYASELLYARMGPRISRADAGLATELTLGVLRWQGLLDFLLQRHLDRPVARLDLEVLLALRMGLYQLRFLDRVPAHAAVNESVELAKRGSKRSAAGFVNAVLRRADREAKISGEELSKLLPADDAERLAILYSHPLWMVERWIARLGTERSIAILEINNRPAGLSCALLEPDANAEEIAESLQGDGLTTAPGRWLRSALAISGGNSNAATALQQGKISFQDEASQMVAHLVDAHPGQSVLDLCSAPGGKTLLMARSVMPGGHVTAADLHEHRLRSTRQQLSRTATKNVELLALDATQPLPFPRHFDRILLDAPCSGTGTLARNPEIRWRLQPDDLPIAHRQQVAMLGQALAIFPPGGRLVYATCSLEPEENEMVVQEALASDEGVHVIPGLPALASHLRENVSGAELFDDWGFFRSFPPDTQTDGFFAAVLERKK